jgi:hypothetical protein
MGFIMTFLWLFLFLLVAAAAAQADDKVKRKRTANALREQLLREIAELQCLAITTLRTSPEYAQRVNELLNRGTEIAASTNIDKADSVSNLQGGLALVSQARAIVAGAGAR